MASYKDIIKNCDCILKICGFNSTEELTLARIKQHYEYIIDLINRRKRNSVTLQQDYHSTITYARLMLECYTLKMDPSMDPDHSCEDLRRKTKNIATMKIEEKAERIRREQAKETNEKVQGPKTPPSQQQQTANVSGQVANKTSDISTPQQQPSTSV